MSNRDDLFWPGMVLAGCGLLGLVLPDSEIPTLILYGFLFCGFWAVHYSLEDSNETAR
jgi:hypothetical protein